MSELLFGGGVGEISDALAERIEAATAEYGVVLVRHRPAGCNCGGNCNVGCVPWAECPAVPQTYWFAGPNRGQGFDDQLRRDVFAALDAAGIKLPVGKGTEDE